MMFGFKTSVVIAGVLTSGIAFAGPFGLRMGMSINDIDAKARSAAPGIYSTTQVPKPHSAFENYGVKVAPKSGLCWVKAVGKDISTSAYGMELKAAFKEMETKLAKVYGKPEVIDFLMPESIWDSPNDFMMSLIKKERHLLAVWEEGKGAKLSENLVQVGLMANASGGNKGYLSIEYSFSNKDACDKEIASQEDDAL